MYELEGELATQYAELSEALPEGYGVLRLLYTGHNLQRFAQRLGQLNDELPLPQIFEWPDRPNPFLHEESQLQGPDKRSFAAFEQIVLQKRKSGKYFAQAQALLSRQPMQGLAISLTQYLIQWKPEAVHDFVLEWTQRHPQWHSLRFMAASHLLQMEKDIALSEELAQRYQELMLQHQELHAYEIEALDSLTVLCYYLAQALYYTRQELHFERALYALNVCFAIAEAEERASEESPWNQILELWFLRVQARNLEAQMNEFIHPLLRQKQQEWDQRRAAPD